MTCLAQACVPFAELGQVCDMTHPCRPGVATCKTGRCAAPAQLGDRCELLPFSCDELAGLLCSTATRKCQQSAVVSPGMACGESPDGTTTGCVAGGLCSMKNAGVCSAPPADGDPCNGARCLSPAVCSNGTCKVPQPGSCR
jgi:hypothetical protein